MTNQINQFKEFEPLKMDRWILEATPNNIEPYFFNKCKFSINDGGYGKLKVTVLQSTEKTFTLGDLKDIEMFTIKYLNPIGDVVSGYEMEVKFIGLSKKNSYLNDSILKSKVTYQITQIKNIEKDGK